MVFNGVGDLVSSILYATCLPYLISIRSRPFCLLVFPFYNEKGNVADKQAFAGHLYY